DLAVRASHAGFEDDEAARDFALQIVVDADDGTLRDCGVRGKDLLDAAGRETVAGDVDDVVRAAHDMDVAVVVNEAGVGGLVAAGEVLEIAVAKAIILLPQRRQSAGRKR